VGPLMFVVLAVCQAAMPCDGQRRLPDSCVPGRSPLLTREPDMIFDDKILGSHPASLGDIVDRGVQRAT
jgi:hypothetical protein